MDFKSLTDKAKSLVEDRGGLDGIKSEAQSLKDAVTGDGTLAERAQRAREADAQHVDSQSGATGSDAGSGTEAGATGEATTGAEAGATPGAATGATPGTATTPHPTGGSDDDDTSSDDDSDTDTDTDTDSDSDTDTDEESRSGHAPAASIPRPSH